MFVAGSPHEHRRRSPCLRRRVLRPPARPASAGHPPWCQDNNGRASVDHLIFQHRVVLSRLYKISPYACTIMSHQDNQDSPTVGYHFIFTNIQDVLYSSIDGRQGSVAQKVCCSEQYYLLSSLCFVIWSVVFVERSRSRPAFSSGFQILVVRPPAPPGRPGHIVGRLQALHRSFPPTLRPRSLRMATVVRRPSSVWSSS